LLSYTREPVVAEKLEAMVKLGIANSRMKDFYDLDVKERAAFHRFVQRSPIRNTLDSMVRQQRDNVGGSPSGGIGRRTGLRSQFP
jgi:Nucleotidyl transferase AbiEii toxin, Type IV TA system